MSDETTVIRRPDTVDVTTAGAAPLVGITGLMIADALQLTAGEKVLIVGAAGGVGKASRPSSTWSPSVLQASTTPPSRTAAASPPRLTPQARAPAGPTSTTHPIATSWRASPGCSPTAPCVSRSPTPSPSPNFPRHSTRSPSSTTEASSPCGAAGSEPSHPAGLPMRPHREARRTCHLRLRTCRQAPSPQPTMLRRISDAIRALPAPPRCGTSASARPVTVGRLVKCRHASQHAHETMRIDSRSGNRRGGARW